mgnify:FL=1
MIKIELQFTTIAEAVAFLSAGHAATGSALPSGEQANKQTTTAVTEALTKAAAEGQTKPAKVKTDPTPATTAEKPAATQPTAAAVVADAPEKKALDYATDVSPKIALAAKHNRAAVVAALSKFGVAKGTELAADKWPAFVEAMDAILAV